MRSMETSRDAATTRAATLRGAEPTGGGGRVLAHARATRLVPGSNLKGQDVAGAAWTFLLPSLELDLVLCIGTPAAATLRTLSRLATEVAVACLGAGERRRLRRWNA